MFNFKLTDICYLVEANNFEKMTLWETWSQKNKDPIKWESNNIGTLPTVGSLNNRPICISVLIEKIEGVPVGFWHATSALVDYNMITEWFKKEIPQLFPENNSHLGCDAYNFHNCVHHIKELDSKKYKVLQTVEQF